MDSTARLARNLVSGDRAMRTLRLVCEFDRYQASGGIVAAAQALAELLRETVLAEPELRLIPVGGGRLWSFSLPTSWTPVVAELRLPDRSMFSLAEHPLLLATNSVAVTRTQVPVRRYAAQAQWGRGTCLSLVPAQQFDPKALAVAGVCTFATDAAAYSDDRGGDVRGRIELPDDTQLTGFSLDARQYHTLDRLAEASAAVNLRVEIDRSAPMPTLSWTVPGGHPGEIWVMAHLCHQRPSANDNASGVAGLVETTRCLKSLAACVPFGKRRTVRFFTGPEFVGIAAFLHDMRHSAVARPAPEVVLNLDMIGQDTGQCGGLFRVERCPMAIESHLAAVVEYMVAQVFAEEGLDHAPMPFKGYSDNSVFTAGGFTCPTVQLCHDRDRFNHSSGDTFDRICVRKFASVIAATAASLIVLAAETTEFCILRQEVFDAWLKREQTAFEQRAEQLARVGHRDWARDYLADRLAAVENARASGACRAPECDEATVLLPIDSPVNLRGLMSQARGARRDAYLTRLGKDKETYSAVLNAVVSASRGKTFDQAVRAASYQLGKPLTADLHKMVLDLLEDFASCGLKNS
ncbi:M28 family peptidase [Rhizobium johnstonii]|uniref:M28 family peptidase n=1 Tax=Rhizobium johnstonii TaxID=3019933 RepID=UPI003F9AD170